MDLLSLFNLSQSLQFIIGHGHDGQDQVDEVEGTQEDVQHEEDDVIGTSGSQSNLQI